eukprot:759121-Alexandrium_andersonii.AAC.1
MACNSERRAVALGSSASTRIRPAVLLSRDASRLRARKWAILRLRRSRPASLFWWCSGLGLAGRSWSPAPIAKDCLDRGLE